MNKYGIENFTIEEIEKCDDEKVLLMDING